jgi:hypothetical protein
MFVYEYTLQCFETVDLTSLMWRRTQGRRMEEEGWNAKVFNKQDAWDIYMRLTMRADSIAKEKRACIHVGSCHREPMQLSAPAQGLEPH